MIENDPLTMEVKDDPKRPYKAIAATVLTAVGTFIAYWVADADPFTSKDVGEAALAALIASGLVGGTTFAIPNPLVRKSYPIPPTDQTGGSL
jgi:hypothetical protein